jgi:hypothetical protein
MKPKQEEVEETEDEIIEPDENDIETADDEVEDKPKQKQPKIEPAMVTVVLTNGAKHTGEFLGDDPQYTMLDVEGNKKLVKMDSYWVNLKTETMVMKINRRFVLSITQLIPKPQKQQGKSRETIQIEDDMDKIMDMDG